MSLENKVELQQFIGRVQQVRGQVVEVISDSGSSLPEYNELLTSSGEGKVYLEVFSYAGERRISCLLLTPKSTLRRGMKIISTGRRLTVPVGDKVLGRVIDLFGEVQAGEESLDSLERKSIYVTAPDYDLVETSQEVVETGIKQVDLLTPFVRGGRVGIVGGAGVGKTVLMTEILHNVTSIHDDVTVFCGVGERIREGHELWKTLRKTHLLDRTVLLLGQMNENAAIRFRTAQAGAALAQYFRDDEKKNVLFFIDNVYRFIQAGSELATLLGRIPAELGYQSTLEAEIASFEGSLASTGDGYITSVQNVYVPADEFSDPAVSAIMSHLDTVLILDRDIAQRGLYPPIDPIRSSSTFLKKNIVGWEHYEIVNRSLELLSKHDRLSRIVSIVGAAELSVADRQTFQRGERLLNYFSQPFFTTENQTWREGVFVERAKTIRDVKLILEGEIDDVEPGKLKFIGSLEDLGIVS